MTCPTPLLRARPSLGKPWLVVCCLLVSACLLGLLIAAPARIANAAAAVGRAVRESDDATILRTSGIAPELVASIRRELFDGGRLVIYSPYGGGEFEMDANDARGEMARQVREMWGRMKNLLYPRPRDVTFARSADELRPKLAPELVGKLLVLDGTQEPTPLVVGGRYRLVHEVRLGQLRMRLWCWEGA